MYKYNGLVKRVVDGDTFDIKVDVGFSITINHRFRLHGVDAPETWRPRCEAERVHGEQATLFVKKLIEGKQVIVQTYKLGIYGRYNADIIINGKQVSDLLIQNKLIKLDSYPSDEVYLKCNLNH